MIELDYSVFDVVAHKLELYYVEMLCPGVVYSRALIVDVDDLGCILRHIL